MSFVFHGYWAISPISLSLKCGILLARLLRGFSLQTSNNREIDNLLNLKHRILLRSSSEVYSASIRKEQLTDTIMTVEELGWSWVLVDRADWNFLLGKHNEKIQVFKNSKI